MIERTTAIPLSWYPWSSTSRVVHWFSRKHGKISTLLKGATRPNSPFLGEYQLFGTSELLFYTKRNGTLYPAKECALLTPRNAFRSNWRSALAASYLTALMARTTPEEAPFPDLFLFFEQQLDAAKRYGEQANFLLSTELAFCAHQGHPPNLTKACLICSATDQLAFCPSQGGLICPTCTKEKKIATLECPPDIQAILISWLQSSSITKVLSTRLSTHQRMTLNTIVGTFINYHFSLPATYRNCATNIELSPTH